MIFIKVYLETGDYFTTGFNGTFEEAVDYYVDHYFNIGTSNESSIKCVKIELVT
jgi:hypothetical protein